MDFNLNLTLSDEQVNKCKELAKLQLSEIGEDADLENIEELTRCVEGHIISYMSGSNGSNFSAWLSNWINFYLAIRFNSKE